MAYSIGLYFDEETEALVNGLGKEIAENGWSRNLFETKNRPHITLGIFTDTDVSRAQAVVQQIARQVRAFPLTFYSIGIFPSPEITIFWAPVVTQALLEIHSTLNQRCDAFSTLPDYDYYRPGRWVPHCGLAMDVAGFEKAGAIIAACDRLARPYQAQVTGIGLISFQPVEPIFTRSLAKPL